MKVLSSVLLALIFLFSFSQQSNADTATNGGVGDGKACQFPKYDCGAHHEYCCHDIIIKDPQKSTTHKEIIRFNRVSGLQVDVIQSQ